MTTPGKGDAWRISHSENLFLATFDQLLAKTDLIVRGRVVSETSRLSPDEEYVLTDYTTEVLEVFKDSGHSTLVGDKLVLTKVGGNILVDGKPIRWDTPHSPPIAWIEPHVFLISRSKERDGELYLASSEFGAFPLRNGKVVCRTRGAQGHPVSKDFCGMTEEEFIQQLKNRVASQESSGLTR